MRKQQQARTVVDGLAEDFVMQLREAGYSRGQIIEHLRFVAALWAAEMPVAAAAYNKLADEIDGGQRR